MLYSPVWGFFCFCGGSRSVAFAVALVLVPWWIAGRGRGRLGVGSLMDCGGVFFIKKMCVYLLVFRGKNTPIKTLFVRLVFMLFFGVFMAWICGGFCYQKSWL